MSVIRVGRRRQYTQIEQKTLRDPRMSIKARGLLTYCLSFPDDWTFSIRHMTRSLPDGRQAIRTALAELVELGYAVRIKPRKQDGTIAGTEYIIHEKPQSTERPKT